MSLSLSVLKIAFILLPVLSSELASSMLLITLPLPLIYIASRLRYELALSLDHPFLPLAFIYISILINILASSVPRVVHKLSIIFRIISAQLDALAVLLIALPAARIAGPIGACECALALFEPVYKLTHIFALIRVFLLPAAMASIVLPLACVFNPSLGLERALPIAQALDVHSFVN